MKSTSWKSKISTILHGLAYVMLIINLILMNLNVLAAESIFIIINISLGLFALLLCIIILFLRKGTDNTPLFGILINAYTIIIVMGTIFFYDG